jgi:Ring finger domain
MSLPAAMTEVSTWYLFYAASDCAASSLSSSSASYAGGNYYSLWMWMTLGVVGFKLCTNAVQFYNFCVAWNLISHAHRVDLQVLHFSKKNFMARKIQIDEALDTIRFGDRRRPAPTPSMAEDPTSCGEEEARGMSETYDSAFSTAKSCVISQESDSAHQESIESAWRGGGDDHAAIALRALHQERIDHGYIPSKNPKAAKEHFHTASSCPICLADFQPKEMISCCKDASSCSHVFHNDCLQMWLFKHESCPICRFQLVPQASPPPLPVALMAGTRPRGPTAVPQ